MNGINEWMKREREFIIIITYAWVLITVFPGSIATAEK